MSALDQQASIIGDMLDTKSIAPSLFNKEYGARFIIELPIFSRE